MGGLSALNFLGVGDVMLRKIDKIVHLRRGGEIREDSSVSASFRELLLEAGLRFADYEQNLVSSPSYRQIELLFGGIALEALSNLAVSPVPGGTHLEDVMGSEAQLSNDEDRWQ